jgi:glycosyltransferase involved in cell wall biosynthesis
LEKARKKVLIVVNYYRPYVSGVSEYAKYLAENLGAGFEVSVLTGRHDKSLPEKEFIDGCWIYRANPLMFLDKGYLSLDFFILFRKLSAQADVVNIHFPMLESGLLSIMTKTPILLTYQCDMALEGSWLGQLAVRAVRFSGSLALEKAQKVIVLSLDYAKHSAYLSKYNDKILQVYPPNRFSTQEINNSSLGVTRPEGYKVVGFVGRFVKEKGIDVLLTSAKSFKGEKVVFWLAGDFENVAGGSIISDLRVDIEAMGHQVILLGSLDDDKLTAFYSQIDILVLPSVNPFEAFGMVQLEAMTFGAIPVTSNLPGVSEVVNRTGVGRLAIPGSHESLTSSICSAIIDCDVTSRKLIKNKVNEQFSNDLFVEQYSSTINDLADGKIS